MDKLKMDNLEKYSKNHSTYTLSRFDPSPSDEVELPSFDDLMHLAQKDPDSFEALRKELCDRTIAQAPINKRKRMRGLQFKIDMERKRCESSLASCIRISELMNESLQDLSSILVDPEGFVEQRQSSTASVIRFRPSSAQ